jgi:UDP-N-acetylglucosamine transferase subunit ALG13
LIFLSLGTHEDPFPRALDLIRPIAAEEEVVVQHGHTSPEVIPGARMIEFASPSEIHSLMDEARAVACHAGVGTIITALAHRHTPVVIPRLRRHGEHVDDHQLQIAEEFEEEGLVVALHEGETLSGALVRATLYPRGDRPGSTRLRSAVGFAARSGV